MKKSLLYNVIGAVLGAGGIFVGIKAHKAECEELYKAGYDGVYDAYAAAREAGLVTQEEEPEEEQ